MRELAARKRAWRDWCRGVWDRVISAYPIISGEEPQRDGVGAVIGAPLNFSPAVASLETCERPPFHPPRMSHLGNSLSHLPHSRMRHRPESGAGRCAIDRPVS